MSQKFSASKISRLPRRRTYGIALLQVIVIIIAAVNPAQPNRLAQEKRAQRPGQERFQATPLYPTSTIVMSAAEKSAALEGGWDRSAAITAPEQVAACSPAISIAPGIAPAGYLPLSGFGVPPVPGTDDDTVTNFTVPAYSYGGQTYTTIGMASNGYAVVGGGNGIDDNQFVNQLFPNPVRPNNVLAPFWTDLLPSAGGALRIATLTDGLDTWIVLDWEAVKYFSTTDTVSFQIWIGINSDTHPVEDITYPYGPISGAGNNNALTVGAENAFGDRGANRYFSFFGGGSTGTLPANGTQLRVSSSTPASCLNQGAETAIGLTASNELVTFNTNAPTNILYRVPITGLLGGESVIAIDFRPLGGQLFGFTNNNRLVTINESTGAATLVGTPNTLSGNDYGFDFNPTVDRIRVVNDLDQNARLNPNNGTTAGTDTNLAFSSGDPFFGNDPTVTGAAHTNNVLGATSTTLYDIDSGLDILVTQGSINGTPTSPNTGQLFTIGSLGVDTSNLVGLDISGNTGIAYASLTNPSNVSSLYTINLTTGSATLVGQVGNSATSLRDMTISPSPPLPIVGVTTSNNLVIFNSARPDLLLSNTPITGLNGGETVIGIDYRPATDKLYGLTSLNRLVTLDTATATATVVAPLSVSVSGTEFGVDFNPTNDRFRIVSDADQNASVDPGTGVVTLQTPLNPGSPNITGVAYTNSFAGATTTTLYDIDSNTDSLYIQNPPASGTLSLVGGLGFNTGAMVGFDISGRRGIAYASLSDPSTGAASLYSINLTSGPALFLGQIGGSSPTILRDIAIAPLGTFQLSSATANVNEGAGKLTVTVNRTGNTMAPASINVSTTDGTATQKGDYTIRVSKLDFGQGETSKTLDIFITDDTLVEGNESFTVNLSNPTAEFGLNGTNTLTVTITDNDVAPAPNAIDSTNFFVRQHYLDFLNREPDTAGFNFWTNNISVCGADPQCIEAKRIDTSAAFFLSIEFQRSSLLAYLANKVALPNATTPSGVLYAQFQRDAQAIQKDLVFGQPNFEATLEANKQAYFSDFVSRPAFLSAYPASLTNAQYVDNLLTSAGISPTKFVVNLTNSQEVPPVNVSGRPGSYGVATFTIDPTTPTLTFSATINNIDVNGSQSGGTTADNLAAAHIHAGPAVAPGVNGPVVWGFFGAPFNDNNPNDQVVTPFASGVGGTFAGKWDPPEGNNTTLAAQLSNLQSGHAYINFHTTAFGGGEVRGNFPAGLQTFRDSLVNGLNAGTETRATVMRKITEFQPLSDLEYTRFFVTMEYFGYLRRDPDTPGFNFWLEKLNSFGGDYNRAEMVKAFLSSSEYRQRFGAN